jgi:sugar lactone lactonase YvrE
MIHGTGAYRYRAVPGWGTVRGKPLGGVLPGVAVDAAGCVHVTRRTPPSVVVFDPAGRFLGEWGEGVFRNPHLISADAEGTLWVTDTADHTVRRFDAAGRLLAILGTPGAEGAPGKPFRSPTKAVRTASGDLVVADGYGQQRVHRMGPDGKVSRSWGSKGSGPGEFLLPHGIAEDAEGNLYVCDRENKRIQYFDGAGTYRTEISDRDWPGMSWPNDAWVDRDGALFVAEAGHRVSVWRKSTEPLRSPIHAKAGAWELLARWGDPGSHAGQFLECPHSLCGDRDGNLYVTEVPWAPGRITKFERVP